MFCLQVYTGYYIFNYCYYNIACKILPRLYLPVITAGSRNTVGAIVLKKKSLGGQAKLRDKWMQRQMKLLAEIRKDYL